MQILHVIFFAIVFGRLVAADQEVNRTSVAVSVVQYAIGELAVAAGSSTLLHIAF